MNFQCERCGKGFNTSRGLKVHANAKHKPVARSLLHDDEPEAVEAAAEAPTERPHGHPNMEQPHSHEWGSKDHRHPQVDGPPLFYEDAVHPDITAGVQAKHDADRPEKTEEEKERDHAQAITEAARADAEARNSLTYKENERAPIGDDDADLVFHVLADGWTTLGKVWYSGEEIHLRRGSPLFELTVDKFGNSWTDLSAEQQLARWKEVRFAEGPWPGERPMTEEEYFQAAMRSDDPDALRQYEKKQQRGEIPAIRVPTPTR